MKHIVYIFFAISLFFSCSTIKNEIKMNSCITRRTISNLLKSNGNVFYIRSTNIYSSSVWTYSKNKLQIYKLSKGRIEIIYEYTLEKDISFTSMEIKYFEDFQQCIELDGEMFGFRIQNKNQFESQDFAINIQCLVQGDYQSDLLKKVVEDIKNYKIWDNVGGNVPNKLVK